MKKNKLKKILLISLIALLAIGTLGMSIAFFGKDDFNWVKGKVEDAFVKEEKVSKNLLKNSNFAINSSEISVFDETNVSLNKAVVDDWLFFANNLDTVDFTAYQVEDGFYIKNEGTETVHLSQRVVDGETLYVDKDITLSVSINGVVYSISKLFSTSSAVTLNVSSNVGSSVKILADKGTCNVSMFFNAGFEGVVNWIQFEEGNVFTGYVAPAVVVE